MKKFISILIALCCIFASCSSYKIKDNQIIMAPDNAASGNPGANGANITDTGLDTFKSIDYSRIQKDILSSNAVIAVSQNNNDLFLMSMASEKDKSITLFGDPNRKVYLQKYDISSGKLTTIASDIPFVSTAKWNSDGSLIAFCGGGELRIFDNNKNRFIMTDEAKNDDSIYFGWSPDGKKIFTEHENLPNGSIYYTDSQKRLFSYETSEKVYYKGNLGEKLFYGTKSDVPSGKEKSNIEYKTVILDSSGNVIKELGRGCFRDSYKNEMIQTGETGAELYFYPDVNSPEKSVKLTDKFVFDAKFVTGGKIAYITKNQNKNNDYVDGNGFILHITDEGGKELTTFEVSGAFISLFPDGKAGNISGSRWERFNFETCLAESQISDNINKYSSDDKAIFNTAAGAIDTWLRMELLNQKDSSAVDQYYIDTPEINELAHFDMSEMFKERKEAAFLSAVDYSLHITVKSFSRFTMNGFEMASLYASGWGENSGGSGMGVDRVMELVKKAGKWYVTGLSIYSQSAQYKDMAKRANQYIADLKSGKLFDGKLKGKDISIAQIQFWEMSEPHLAQSINTANYCKIYLRVRDNGNEEIYKFIVDKKNQKDWKPSGLDNQRLSYLF